LGDRSHCSSGIADSGRVRINRRLGGRSHHIIGLWRQRNALYPRNLSWRFNSSPAAETRLDFLANNCPDMLKDRGQKSFGEERAVLRNG
jgi:hypothetical protein